MFDIAPSELLLLAVVALVFIGPKDLPKVMRVVGRWVGKARGMAGHFRAGLDEMMRQAELEELEKKWKAENERIMREHPLAAPFDMPGDGPAIAPFEMIDASPAAAPPAMEAPVPDPLSGESLADPPGSAAELFPPGGAPAPDPEAPELPLPPAERPRRALP